MTLRRRLALVRSPPCWLSRPWPMPNRPRSTARSKVSCRDTTGAVLPGVTIHVANVDTGAQRSLTSGADGGFRALLLPLGTYTVRAEMQGFKAAERTGVKLSAGQTATLNFTLEVGGVAGGRLRQRRGADRGAGQDRPRPHDQRGRDQEPAAGLAQPLQLRVPAGQRHRLRERGVRRAAHQRQRHPDAHQLPDRRQHQHREGPRRPAPAARSRRSWSRRSRSSPAASPPSSARPRAWSTTRSRPRAPTSSRARPASASGARDSREKPFFLAATAPKPDTNVNNWTATAGRADREGPDALLRGVRVRGPRPVRATA